MKFGICNEIFQEWGEFARVCDYVSDVGYDGIELAPFTFAEHVTDISAQTRREIVDRAKENGIEIIGLHWLLVGPDGLHLTTDDIATRDRTAQYLIDLAHCCAEVGGTRMVFGSPKQRNVAEDMHYDQALANARRVFEQVLPTLEDHGITLCLEPLAANETNFCTSADQAVELIEAIDHPNFQLILDVKAMIDEPLGRPDTIRHCAPYLKHFHANDDNLYGPGLGDVDFAPIFQALRDVDYDQYLSVEVFKFDIGCVAIAGSSYEYMKGFV